jgi:hypothetical protein
MQLISKTIGVGFFYYGPRLWMVGEVEPLKMLDDPKQRSSIITRILNEYPDRMLSKDDAFYRIRKEPKDPAAFAEYDSPPLAYAGTGRLDLPGFAVMYGSQDLQVCIHECRVTAEDELYVATLAPQRDLKLLDLTAVLEEDVTEFESLDMAVHMLFLAGKHAYEISRAIAVAAHEAGYDGVIYPSYFSLLRTGSMPFETTYGLSHRRIKQFAELERSKIIPNVALFGHPIQHGTVIVKCVNRLLLHRVEYGVKFGPVGY